jgi:hypothetical protein
MGKLVAALRAEPGVRAEPRQLRVLDAVAATGSCEIAYPALKNVQALLKEMLAADPSLFERLPALLRGAGMDCDVGPAGEPIVVQCGCRVTVGAFVNPCRHCGAVTTRGRTLIVAAHKRFPKYDGGKLSYDGFDVEVSYYVGQPI